MKNTNKSIFENYPDVVTVEQLASMLGISTKTAYKLVKEKQIKSVCIGRIYKKTNLYRPENQRKCKKCRKNAPTSTSRVYTA